MRYPSLDGTKYPDDTRDLRNEGDWCWKRDDSGRPFLFVCVVPGDDSPRLLPVTTSKAGQHKWNWDGNEETPTLSPSISARKGDHNQEIWHGYVKCGRFEGV